MRRLKLAGSALFQIKGNIVPTVRFVNNGNSPSETPGGSPEAAGTGCSHFERRTVYAPVHLPHWRPNILYADEESAAMHTAQLAPPEGSERGESVEALSTRSRSMLARGKSPLTDETILSAVLPELGEHAPAFAGLPAKPYDNTHLLPIFKTGQLPGNISDFDAHVIMQNIRASPEIRPLEPISAGHTVHYHYRFYQVEEHDQSTKVLFDSRDSSLGAGKTTIGLPLPCRGINEALARMIPGDVARLWILPSWGMGLESRNIRGIDRKKPLLCEIEMTSADHLACPNWLPQR